MFSIEALADIDPRTLELVGRQYHVDHLHTDHRRLLEEDLDAVLILYGGSHVLEVVDAARAGKNVFVEKPLGWNSAQIETAAAEVERTG